MPAKRLRERLLRGEGVNGVVVRSLDDLSTLRGAPWEEVEALFSEVWKRGSINKGEGIKFVNTANKGEQILMEKGWADATDLLHAVPYLKTREMVSK